MTPLEVICAYLPYNCMWVVTDDTGKKIKGRIRSIDVSKGMFVKLDLAQEFQYYTKDGKLAKTYDPKVEFSNCIPILKELDPGILVVGETTPSLRSKRYAVGLEPDQYIQYH
jgi:hypothetical protein